MILVVIWKVSRVLSPPYDRVSTTPRTSMDGSAKLLTKRVWETWVATPFQQKRGGFGMRIPLLVDEQEKAELESNV